MSRAAGTPGTAVTASGAGFGSGTAVRFSFGGQTAHTVAADATGAASAVLTVPRDAAPGPTTIAAHGVDAAGEAYTLSAAFTVLPAGAAAGSGAARTAGAAGSGALVATGTSGTVPLAAAAFGLIVVGAAATAAGRRRRGDSSR